MFVTDVADTAALAAGVPGAAFKVSKQGAKLAIRQARKAVRRGLDDAIQAGRKAGDRLTDAFKPARARRNGHLAWDALPKTGIPFDRDGYPDFTKLSKMDVKIELTGTRAGDFRAANKAAGFDKTPAGHSWHHHQDGTTLQLVPRTPHTKTGHDGGYSGR